MKESAKYPCVCRFKAVVMNEDGEFYVGCVMNDRKLPGHICREEDELRCANCNDA